MSKLHIERIGGLAGVGGLMSHLRSTGEIALEALSPADRQAVERLFRARTRPKPGLLRDGFRYRITLATPKGPKTIEVGEAQLPASVIASVKDELV